MTVDLECFKKHLAMAPFQMGLDANDWGIACDYEFSQWPSVFLWVKSAIKAGSPDKYFFKFDLENYPAKAPKACPWDIEAQKSLSFDKWPRGNKYVSKVFNPSWKPNALYAPCDRVAMDGHGQWAEQYKNLWWQPDFTIVKYLQFLHKLLNSKDYING